MVEYGRKIEERVKAALPNTAIETQGGHQLRRQRNMAQMNEQIKTPEKELIEEIDNLSDAEFKTLVIRVLTELIEPGHKIKEEMKTTPSEIKQNI